MLGRIVFLHFVQKKSWMGASDENFTDGDQQFMYNLWKNSKQNSAFYQSYLVPLFFDALNQNNRTNSVFTFPDEQSFVIPYLGGGLFEKDKDEPDFLTFPKEYFDNLFEFFHEYNFTIDENDPFENEVGIDPEMLGHIFENLLEDNKDKGAFYTPKPIVKYMCQESLIQYFITSFEKEGLVKTDNEKTNLENQIGNFVRKYEAKDIIEYDHILSKALYNVKICDPAIGSGAFPMGLLNEMVMLINVLHSASPDVVEDRWKMENWQPASVKKHIIQNSIYGVDIEKGAVDIARLRFWLSLIIDEDKPTTLPSLDYKIVIGNSLLPKFDDDIIEIDWNLINNPGFQQSRPDLYIKFKNALKDVEQNQRQYFSAENNDKTELAKKIRDSKINLLTVMVEFQRQRLLEMGIQPELARNRKEQIANSDRKVMFTYLADVLIKLRNILQNPSLPFNHFDWELDFPEILNASITKEVGFDIIIANPPYVEHKKLKHIAYLLKPRYEVSTGSSDLSVYFFELGLKLLKRNGELCYINTNKFFNTGYGKPLRAYILENQIKRLLNFEQVEVFEGILVSSVIIGIKKYSPKTESKFFYKKFLKLKHQEFNSRFKDEIANYGEYLQSNLTESEWSFANHEELNLKLKIDSRAQPLKNIAGVKLYRGITTGFDPAFIINYETAQELGFEPIIKPLLKGEDIKKYRWNFSDRYLINSHNGLRSSNILPVNVEKDYPKIYNHLLYFYDESSPGAIHKNNGEITCLKNRSDQGENWFNLRNCAFLEMFDLEKIIWPLTADKWGFALDANKHFLTSGGFFLTSEVLSIRYILALLNSKLMEYYFQYIGVMTAGGAFTLKKSTIEELPIVISDKNSLFDDFVEEIIRLKRIGGKTNELENQVDIMVYKLYQLEYEEILGIDPEFEMSEEEYEAFEIE